RDYNVITMTAKTRIVRIGNSRGIRIPKTLLEEAELGDEVELHAEPGRLVIEGVRHARKGWAAIAQRMRGRSDDQLLDEPTSTKFDREEWEWREPGRRSVAARSISCDSIPRSAVKSRRRDHP